MYTRPMVDKFVADIKTTRTVDGDTLEKAVATLQFEVVRGVEVCMGGAFRDALEGTAIEYLIDELGRRWPEFAIAEELAWEKGSLA